MNIENVPERIAKLPRDDRGYPVPWFVAWVDGRPDFRVIEGGRIFEALKERRCWVCGEKLGRYLAFVIGPMCAINRITSEPPSHRDCALFAARACPFLTMPRMKRNERAKPEGYQEPAGFPSREIPASRSSGLLKGLLRSELTVACYSTWGRRVSSYGSARAGRRRARRLWNQLTPA
jgi:hypothetical protein